NDFSFHPFVSNKEIIVKSTTVIPHIRSKLTFGCATYTSKAYANTIAFITKLTIEKNPCIFPIHNKTKIKIQSTYIIYESSFTSCTEPVSCSDSEDFKTTNNSSPFWYV